jgi:hypothetical protein
MTAANEGRSWPLTILALAVGLGCAGFCAYTIHRTAQMPLGDGTGMQWVVLGPLALLFFGVAAPALIVGINGLRAAFASPESVRRGQARAFGALKTFLMILAALVFGVMPLIGMLITLLVD